MCVCVWVCTCAMFNVRVTHARDSKASINNDDDNSSRRIRTMRCNKMPQIKSDQNENEIETETESEENNGGCSCSFASTNEKKKWNWNRIAAAASSQPAIISLSSLNHAEVVFKVRIFSVFWFRGVLILVALHILSLGWWKSASPWIVTEINEEWNWNEKKSRKIRVCH